MTGSAVAVHAAVLMAGGDVVPPGLDAGGDSRDHPHAGFGRRLAGKAKVAGAGLIHGHAFGGEFVPAENAVDAFAGVAVLLEAGGIVAALMIEHHDFGALGRFRGGRGRIVPCWVTEPLFMPDQMQSLPPAARVTLLFNSQISMRRW